MCASPKIRHQAVNKVSSVNVLLEQIRNTVNCRLVVSPKDLMLQCQVSNYIYFLSLIKEISFKTFYSEQLKKKLSHSILYFPTSFEHRLVFEGVYLKNFEMLPNFYCTTLEFVWIFYLEKLKYQYSTGFNHQ